MSWFEIFNTRNYIFNIYIYKFQPWSYRFLCFSHVCLTNWLMWPFRLLLTIHMISVWNTVHTCTCTCISQQIRSTAQEHNKVMFKATGSPVKMFLSSRQDGWSSTCRQQKRPHICYEWTLLWSRWQTFRCRQQNRQLPAHFDWAEQG